MFDDGGLLHPQPVARVIHDEIESLEYGGDGHVDFFDHEGLPLQKLSQAIEFQAPGQESYNASSQTEPEWLPCVWLAQPMSRTDIFSNLTSNILSGLNWCAYVNLMGGEDERNERDARRLLKLLDFG